jgi:PAS domain S-box-containing protein
MTPDSSTSAISARLRIARRQLDRARSRLVLPAIQWTWLRILVAVALAAAVNWAYRETSPFLGSRSPFLVLSFIAVIASAWAGRLLSGLTTLLLCTGLWLYYFSVPPKSFQVESMEDLRLILLFLAAGVLICLIVEALYTGKRRGEIMARDRHQVAETLLVERQRLAALLSNLPGMVWEVELDEATLEPRPTFVSANCARLLGRSADDLLAAPLPADMFEASERAAVFKALEEVAAGGDGRSLKHRILRTDGALRWFETYLAAGTPAGSRRVRCVSHDITEQENVDRTVARIEDRFRAVADLVPIPIWIARPGEGMVWANRAWLDFRGRPFDEESGFAWIEGVHPDEAGGLAERFLELLERREEFRLEVRLKRADAAWRWLLAIGVPRLSADGSYQDCLGFTIDMSDRKQLEMEREALLEGTELARQAAEVATHSKDELLAKVSHELRNPLNGILGWTQILRRGDASDEDLEKGIELIDLGARTLVQLVDDLLDVSRITAGKMRLSLAPADLKRVIEAACQSVTPTAAAKGVTLDCQLDSPVPLVMGDARRLQQIAWNLLANAVKFTPRGGRVEVKVERRDAFAVLSVKDTGIGISPEFLPHVFSAFAQQEEASTRRYRGLGLGLAIVRHLTELHGGRAVAHSSGTDEGSTFEIWLPAAVDQRALVAVAPESVEEIAESSKRLADLRVLVVDDDSTALELLPRLLSRAGAQVHTAASAEAGLAAILAFHPNVLVSDVEMPGTDGFSFLRRVRALSDEEGGAVPAVALTAYVREEERRRILLAGFQAHLGKPVSADELVETVAHLAGRGPASADEAAKEKWIGEDSGAAAPGRARGKDDLLN